MNAMSATRNPDAASLGPNQTEFQIYVGSRSLLKDGLHKLLDFTEHKLLRYAENVFGTEKLNVMVLITEYRKGNVAVCWKHGKPHYIQVKRESTGR
jgi:hypothetical protein